MKKYHEYNLKIFLLTINLMKNAFMMGTNKTFFSCFSYFKEIILIYNLKCMYRS